MAINDELNQTTMVKPIRQYIGSPYVYGVVPKNSIGREVLAYMGNPVVVPRGPGKRVRIA